MPKLVIAQTKKFHNSDPSFQELPLGYKNEQNQELSDISNMVSFHHNVARKPYTELLKSSVSQAFPNQLMEILSIKEYEDIISWTPDGKSFFIHDKKKLNAVLTCYFQSTKYDSFRRKLHRWGFRIAKKGSSAGAYTHKLFARDNPSLCSKMKCVKQSYSAKTSERSFAKSSTLKHDMVVRTETKSLGGTIKENQEVNQQSYSLKAYDDIEKHKSIFFQNYVMTMHANFWRKRPLLLEGSFYLQRHMQSINQSSKKLGAINGLLTINGERQLSPVTINNKMEFGEEIKSPTISNKSIEGSAKPFAAADQNVQIKSSNAIAA